MVAMRAGRASREEAQDASGNGDFAVGAGDAVEEGLEFRRVVDGQVVGFVREVEGGLGPNQELGVLKSAEGVLEPSRGESGDLAEFRALKACVGTPPRAGTAGRPFRGRRTRRGGRRSESVSCDTPPRRRPGARR